MDRLSREEIAKLWKKAMQSSAQEFVGFLRQGLVPNHAHPDNLTLPERFALLIQDRQSLSQEAVREEALEEAARVVWVDGEKPSETWTDSQTGEPAFDPIQVSRMNIAFAIRALKREPNVALPTNAPLQCPACFDVQPYADCCCMKSATARSLR